MRARSRTFRGIQSKDAQVSVDNDQWVLVVKLQVQASNSKRCFDCVSTGHVESVSLRLLLRLGSTCMYNLNCSLM